MADIPFRSRASFKGGALLETNQGIQFSGGAPSSTAFAFYRIGTDLYWNGSPIVQTGSYVHTTGDEAITGIKTFGDGSTSSISEWNKSTTGQIIIAFQTAGVDRQDILIQDSELGSDSGSNMYFAAFTDAGVLIDYPMKWVRAASGPITIGAATRPVYFTGGYSGFGTTSPTSNVHIGKSKSNQVTNTTADLTLTDQHNVILCNNTSAIIITLPNPTTCASREYTIIRGNSGGVTIDDFNGTELKQIAVQYGTATYISNGTSWFVKNDSSNSSGAAAVSVSTSFFYDFNNALTGTVFSSVVAGGGATAAAAAAPDASHPGIMALTVASSGGTAAFWTGGTDLILGNGTLTIEQLVYIGSLATVNQDYVFYTGLIDSTNNVPVDGVFFEYTRATSTSWRLSSRSNSVLTSVVSSITVNANTWYKLKIVIVDTPSTADFYVNNVLVGTVVSGIPVGAGRNTSFGAQLRKVAGGTTAQVLFDYYSAMQSFRTAR